MTTGSEANWEVRPLRARDLAAAAALWEGVPGVHVSLGDEPETLRKFLRRNPGASQAVWSGPQMIGAVLAGHDGRRGYLYHLTIDPAWRGRGVGRALAHAAVARLQALGVLRVLILVADDNDGGHAFWQREGWELIDARPYGFDPKARRPG